MEAKATLRIARGLLEDSKGGEKAGTWLRIGKISQQLQSAIRFSGRKKKLNYEQSSQLTFMKLPLCLRGYMFNILYT